VNNIILDHDPVVPNIFIQVQDSAPVNFQSQVVICMKFSPTLYERLMGLSALNPPMQELNLASSRFTKLKTGLERKFWRLTVDKFNLGIDTFFQVLAIESPGHHTSGQVHEDNEQAIKRMEMCV
jgi:hypothetical protein